MVSFEKFIAYKSTIHQIQTITVTSSDESILSMEKQEEEWKKRR